jgi:nitrogen fixation-related uncharacterized protein
MIGEANAVAIVAGMVIGGQLLWSIRTSRVDDENAELRTSRPDLVGRESE